MTIHYFVSAHAVRWPRCRATRKFKRALNTLAPNHGQIEVVGKAHFDARILRNGAPAREPHKSLIKNNAQHREKMAKVQNLEGDHRS